MLARTGRPPWKILFLSLITGAWASGCGSDTVDPPTVPTGLTAVAGDGYNTLQWNGVDSAESYNYYWSILPGVTRETGFRVSAPTTTARHGGVVNGTTIYYVIEAVNSGGQSDLSSEVSATPVTQNASTDPYYTFQWNLKNTGQTPAHGSSGVSGEDINVESAWNACTNEQITCRGEGVRVAVVDGDLAIAHEDLFANVASGKSHNYLNDSADPTSTDPTDFHGTAVASIIGARDWNGKGIRGVAPRANLVGYNFIASATYANQVDAMTRNISEISVSNNSWGPADGQGLLWAAPTVWKSAIEEGLASGRSGKGTIYVWSAGNGAVGADCPTGNFAYYCSDNSNYDGYANHRGVIAAGAFNAQGEVSSYSEPGANLWVSAPGGEFCDTDLAIFSADAPGVSMGLNSTLNIGYGSYDVTNKDYTHCMNGTSSAAPHVSGVAALVVQANPALNWREVRWALAASARKINGSSAGWAQNGAGFWAHHDYGFGAVDATAAVAYAKSMSSFGAQKTYSTARRTPNSSIPDNSAVGTSDTLTIGANASGISQIEWIEVTVQTSHNYSGDLLITLTHSDTGMASTLAESHYCAPVDDSYSTPRAGDCDAYSNWVFGDARHLGESPAGNWVLKVADRRNGNTGTLQAWSLKFYGR